MDLFQTRPQRPCGQVQAVQVILAGLTTYKTGRRQAPGFSVLLPAGSKYQQILMDFGFQFMRQVLFGERTTEEAAGAWEERVEDRRELWEMGSRVAIAKKQEE